MIFICVSVLTHQMCMRCMRLFFRDNYVLVYKHLIQCTYDFLSVSVLTLKISMRCMRLFFRDNYVLVLMC